MTGTIFGAGGGDERQSYLLDQQFFALGYPDTRPILYIPLALGWDDYGPAKDWFGKLVSLHCPSGSLFEIVEKDNDLFEVNPALYSSIYIGGGNTFTLLSAVKEAGFDTLLKMYFENGGIIYGGSAGAIILGKDVATVSEEAFPEFKYSTEALNFFRDLHIRCHYQQADIPMLMEYSGRYGCVIAGIPEESGIVLKGDAIKVYGSAPAAVVIPSKEIQLFYPGSDLSF